MKALVASAQSGAVSSPSQLTKIMRDVDSENNGSNIRLYRLPQVLERIPVSRSSWFAGIQAGRYPRGYSLGMRTTVWRSDEIDQLVASLTH